jgi:hypothetical protein
MFHRKRKLKRNNQTNKLRKLVSSLGIGLLSLIILGFVISGVDRLVFNAGLDTEFPDLSTLITKTTYEKKTGHKIEIEVLNGCDIPKLALMYTHYLRSEGIDVEAYKNADNSQYIKTTILHHRGEIERALELADIMMMDKNSIIEDKDENLMFDLTLILGTDYVNLLSYPNALKYQPPY